MHYSFCRVFNKWGELLWKSKVGLKLGRGVEEGVYEIIAVNHCPFLLVRDTPGATTIIYAQKHPLRRLKELCTNKKL